MVSPFVFPCCRNPRFRSGLLLLFISTAPAATRNWTGAGATGDWAVTQNWQAGLIPGASDTAAFGAVPDKAVLTGPDTGAVAILASGYSIGGAPGSQLVLRMANAAVLTASYAPGTSQIGVPVVLNNAGQSVHVLNFGTVLTLGRGLTWGVNPVLLQNAGRLEISGLSALSGSTQGKLRVTGDGLTILNGACSAGRDVEVSGGELRVAGTLASAHNHGLLTLAPGAVLSGTGTVEQQVIAQGDVSPGNGAGAAGTLTLAECDFESSGGPHGLLMDLRSSGHDRLMLGRRPDLASAGLAVEFQSGWTPPAGAIYEIVTIAGTQRASGEFAGRPQGSDFVTGGLRWRISYEGGTGNDITLTMLATAPTGRRVQWTGQAGDRWALGANWLGGVPPVSGDTVVFGSAAVQRDSRCDMPAGFVCGGIEFGAGAWNVQAQGVPVILTGPVTLLDATTDVVCGAALELGDHTTLAAAAGSRMECGQPVDLNSFTLTVDADSGAQVDVFHRIEGTGGVTKSGGGTLSYSRRAIPGSVSNTYTGPTLVDRGTLELKRSGSVLINGALRVDAGGGSGEAPLCLQSVDEAISGTPGVIHLGFRGQYRLTALQTLRGVGVVGQNKEPVGTRYAVDTRGGLLRLTEEIGLGTAGFTVDDEIITLESRFIGNIEMAPVNTDAEIVLALGARLFGEADFRISTAGEPLRVTGGELFTIEAPQTVPRIEVNTPGLRFHASDPNLHLAPGNGTFTRMDGTVGQLSGGMIAPALASEAADAGGNTIAVLNVTAGLTNPARLDLTQQRSGNSLLTDVIHVQGSVTLTSPVDLTLLPVAGDTTPLVGQVITILTNDGTDAVNGTFRDLPQGSIINAGDINYAISYTGGDGNDITLTVQSPVLSYATFRWNGAGADDLWNNAANWQGGVHPNGRGNLIFEPGSSAAHQNQSTYTGTVEITGTHPAPFSITRQGTRLLSVATQFKCSAQGTHGITVLTRPQMSNDTEIVHSGTAAFTLGDGLGIGERVTLRVTGDSATPTLITNAAGTAPAVTGGSSSSLIKTGAGAVRVEGLHNDIALEVKAGTFTLFPGAANTVHRDAVTVGGGAQTARFEAQGVLNRNALTVLANGTAALTGAQELSTVTLNGGTLTSADTVTLFNGPLITRGADAVLTAPLLLRRDASVTAVEVKVLSGVTLTQTHAAALGFTAASGAVRKTGRGKWIINGVCLPDAAGTNALEIAAGEVALRRLAGAPTGAAEITVGSTEAAGRLTGDGTAESLTLSNGSFAPGIGNTGTFTVNRAVFTAGTYEVEVARNGSDRLEVVAGGTAGFGVTINSAAQISLSLVRQTPLIGEETVILAFGGSAAIEGSFGNAPEGGVLTAGSVRFGVTYRGGDGNDLSLTRLPDTGVTPFLTAGPVNITFTGPGGAPHSILTIDAAVTTTPGASVKIQRSTGLLHWTTLDTVTADAAGLASFHLTDVTGGPRVFFRYLPQ